MGKLKGIIGLKVFFAVNLIVWIVKWRGSYRSFGSQGSLQRFVSMGEQQQQFSHMLQPGLDCIVPRNVFFLSKWPSARAKRWIYLPQKSVCNVRVKLCPIEKWRLSQTTRKRPPSIRNSVTMEALNGMESPDSSRFIT